MMSTNQVAEIRRAGEDINGEIRIDTQKFDITENSGVNLQCVNSSEFMVGKQTNFNGPVTIINYAEGNEQGNLHEQQLRKEEVVIRDRIMAPSVTKTMENFIRDKAKKEMSEMKTARKEKEKKFSVREIWTKIPAFGWGLLLLFILAGLTALILELVIVDDVFPEDVEIIPGQTFNYTLYSRRHWKAAPEESSVWIELPVEYVIISSSGGKNCTNLKSCKPLLQDMQKKEMKITRSDIYPNFLVSSDGSIFEGRGWEKRSAFQGFVNNRNIEIKFIGEFTVYEHPTESQSGAVSALIAHGVETGRISNTYKLLSANSTGIKLGNKRSMVGKNLYAVIRNWSHFESDPYTFLFQGGVPIFG